MGLLAQTIMLSMHHSHTPDAVEDPRFCEARIQLIINTLPATTHFNPVGVLIAAAALYIGGSAFGTVPLVNMVVAIGVQLITAVAARLLYKRHPQVEPGSAAGIRRELVVLQAVIGLSWGAVAWLLWREGNAANNAFVMIIMAMALWAMALTRCSVRTVFLTGIAALIVPLAARFATSSGVAAHVFLGLIPVWVWYMTFSGMAARKHVDEMLRARFAHEDLGKELAAARDEAVEKRIEAESASRSKTAFLANMSHELRTPLNAIIGFSEIISSQALGPNSPRYPEYADDIHVSGTHLLTLINEILDVAKIEAGRMEIDPRPLDGAAVLSNIERVMVIKAAEKELSLVFPQGDLPQLVADERALRQILLNLLSNAVKFTPSGGRIDVVCHADHEGGFVLCVKDTGAGIAPDKLAQLFEPFSQVDNRFERSQGGTGLGLALVKGLARLHGGRAWIESTEGRGTSAFVYFPLAPVKRELKRAAQ